MNRENRLNSFCQVRTPFTLREKSCVLPAHLFRKPVLFSHISFHYLFQSIPLHFSPTIISTLKKSRSFRRDITKYIHKINSPPPLRAENCPFSLSPIHLYTIFPPIDLSSIPRHLLFLPIWIPAVATLLWAFKKYMFTPKGTSRHVVHAWLLLIHPPPQNTDTLGVSPLSVVSPLTIQKRERLGNKLFLCNLPFDSVRSGKQEAIGSWEAWLGCLCESAKKSLKQECWQLLYAQSHSGSGSPTPLPSFSFSSSSFRAALRY